MTRLLAIALLALAFIAGGGWMLTRPAPEDAAATAAADYLPGAAMAQDADADAEAVVIPDMAQGDADAPVTLVEYASFTCPHCASFHADQYQQLRRDYIDTGLVRFVFREVYFDRYGLWASMVARCGGEMRFFGIADRMYETQSEWAAGNDPAAIADNLRRIGLTSGIDAEQLDACLSDGAQASALVAWFEENSEADGIDSTPTLLIDGTKHSNMSYDALSDLLDARLEELGHEAPAK